MSRQLTDWLTYYMAYTEETESPTAYHLWSGLLAISSVLQRKCFCNWGALRGYIYPNLYTCLVGPPGGRKGTAMKIAKSMVQATKVPLGADSLGSTQALYKELMDAEAEWTNSKGAVRKHKSISIWAEEFQVFLADNDPMLLASLTDLFDCADSWRYSTLKRGSEDVSNCFLNIIGAITPSLLQSKLSQDAVGGGLLSRIIFVVGYGPIKKIAIPLLTKEEERLKKCLTEDLQRIALLKGAFELRTEFLKTYARWYENTTSDDGVSSEKFLGYNSRRALHLNKLCMLICASESDKMILLPKHFEKALAILEYTEAEMPQAFQGFGIGDHATKLAKVLSWVEQQRTFCHSDLVQQFRFVSLPHELDIFMNVAEQSGLVKIDSTPTKTIYTVLTKKLKSKGTEFLDATIFSMMKKNIIKRKKAEGK